MRRREPDLTTRVNGNLALEFTPVSLTSYAGLELFGRYLQQTGFNALVREVFARSGLGGDFGPVAMVRVLMALLVVGGRRLRHVMFAQDDPLVRRLSGVRVIPTAPDAGPVAEALHDDDGRASAGAERGGDGAHADNAGSGDADRRKHGLAFGSVPTASDAANSVWQQLVAPTHNLLVNFQLATGAAVRPRSRKRTVLHTLHSIQTLRFVLFHRAGLIVRSQGTLRLRLAHNAATRTLYTRIGAALARAA